MDRDKPGHDGSGVWACREALPGASAVTDGSHARHTAGLGFRQHTPAHALIAIVQEAARRTGVPVEALAAPYFKRGDPALQEAAGWLGLPLHFVAEDALAAAQPNCPTRSAAALAATGHASIAEAAALAASGGTLILARITLGPATCAVARAP